ncbi:cyclic nucleotide-binding domain protein (macronuclear) [Tetrahymena thermophila SB210]|uniref:Cyclic nucleotide-binding domain protein n=1 Tax=Tetrahymena thermophila (strain SB210) TaxID=312017 RepID=Q237I1_TETTS|nr:cyclic nucleotide-binding domain protein [Tetrahymena thermophila SB210]EAR92760.2 cyclic nucleotide-binding domain protein [Tetrahymena thermophila SB210]|eukprot:XP_001013005.2 cyclic nucleotide-binding domain protein [Tetrahymena thermophila SB210]
MSSNEHDNSILSLKYLENDNNLDDEQENLDKFLDNDYILEENPKNVAANSNSNNNNQQNSSSTQIQTSSTEIFMDTKKPTQIYGSSQSSVTMLNKASFTDLGFFLQNNSEYPIDLNSAGANFIRQMLQSNQPMKNYMNYLKKDLVDLTDERDAAVVMQILQKPTKSKNECDFLLKSIQGLHLFQKNKDMLTMKDCNQTLLEKLRLEYFPARKTIFNYGDFGYTYYIVLQGECDLLIPAPTLDASDKSKKDESGHGKSENNKEHTTQHHKHHQEHYANNQHSEVESTVDLRETQTGSHPLSKLGKKKVKLDSKWKVLKQTFNPDQENMHLQEISSPRQNSDATPIRDNETQEQFLERCFVGLKYMKTFKPGEAFGEIALMTKQRRTGTIVCRENTFLMALTKESFDIILGAYHEIIIQRKLNFLKSYNFFRGVPNSKLLSLLHMMKIVNYSNKNIIYTENDPSRFVYLIREGEVEISQVCNIETNVEKEKKKKEEQEDNPNDINAVKAQKEIRNKKKRIPIVIKGKNSYFGEEEILKHIDTRKQQAICSSETAEIFLIKKDILYNYTRGYGVIDKLKEEFKVKGEWNQIRQAKIVQTTQNTKSDIEKQITLLSLKRSSATLQNINETKGLESKSQNSNIFSINQARSQTLLNIPANPVSMTSINSSGNKRNSMMNTFNNNPRTPSQTSGLTLDPFDVMTSKQRLSLRTNPFNPNSLNTLQKQLELGSINKQNQGTANDENSDAFFTTGVGQFSANTIQNQKLTPDSKVHLKLRQNRKSSQQSTFYGIVANESQTPQHNKLPTTITEEENYIENKILNNKMRRYVGESQKTKEQLAQVALEQFGDMSHNAFVNKVGQTLEYKMQILKKLNQNGLQSPTNVFADLYEEFGLKKKTNFKVRKSLAASNQGSQKDLNSKAQSTPNGQDFQKKILQERKNQIKENIKKQNTLNYIEDINLVTSGTLQDHIQRGKTFHSLQQNSMQELNTPDHFSRNKVRASTTINFNTYNHQTSSSQDSRRISDRQKSFDEINLSGYESQTSSQSSITLPKRNSFADKFKNPPMIQVKNLDVLEEVSENNSPVKITQEQTKKRNNTVNEMKSPSQSEYGLSKSQLLQVQYLQQKMNNVQGRMSLESNENTSSQNLTSKSQVFLNPSKQILTNSSNYNTGNSQSQNSDTSSVTNNSNIYTSKSFLNRNATSLKKKQEARRAISRNSSSNSKENSFRISAKQNNFFSLHKTMQYCQSQGNMQHQNPNSTQV